MEFIEQWAWVGWLVLIVLFLAIEVAAGEMTFLMLALGGISGIIAAVAGAPVWLQVVIAAVAAVAALALLRPPLLKRLRRSSDPKRFNVEGLIGLSGIVITTVTALGGRVKLSNGEEWTARVSGGRDLPPHTPVVVDEIQGATAIVTGTGVAPAAPNQEV